MNWVQFHPSRWPPAFRFCLFSLAALGFQGSLASTESELAAEPSSFQEFSTDDSESCAIHYKNHGCGDFFKKNPDLAVYANDCKNPPSAGAMIKSCGLGAATGIINLPRLLLYELPVTAWEKFTAQSSPEAIEAEKLRVNFLKNCAKSMECKLQFWKQTNGSPANEAQEKKLAAIKEHDWHRLETFLRMAELTKKEQNQLENWKKITEITKSTKPGPERDAAIERVHPGWIQKKIESDKALAEAASSAVESIYGRAYCYRPDVQMEVICEGIGSIAGGGVVMKSGKYLLALKRGRAAGEAVAFSAEGLTLKQVSTQIGLKEAEIARINKVVTSDQAQRLSQILSRAQQGETIAANDAQWAAEILDKAKVRGIFAFHRTTAEGLDKIAESKLVFGGGAQGNRVYAFPANPKGDAYWASAGKKVGQEVVVFQGQAATLFGNSPTTSAGGLIGRAHGHQVTQIGKLVVEDFEREGNVLIVKKARLVTDRADVISDLKLRALDALVVTSWVTANGVIYYSYTHEK